MVLKLTVLGSGAWEGIPRPFGKSKIDNLAKNDPNSKNNRTRPEFLIETDKGKFLLEISPDIRLQSTRFDLENIVDFLLTHWHFDHLFGIYELHAWSEFEVDGKINIFCSSKTRDFIENQMAFIPKNIKVIKPFEKFNLHDAEITALPVAHMHSIDKDVPEDELNNVFGYLIEYQRKKLAYLGDYYFIPKKTLELIKNIDLLIADGTFLFEEKFPNKRYQNELKRDPDHIHGRKILEFVKEIKAKKTIFHSISSLTELPHDELQRSLPKGMCLSYDGMQIEI